MLYPNARYLSIVNNINLIKNGLNIV